MGAKDILYLVVKALAIAKYKTFMMSIVIILSTNPLTNHLESITPPNLHLQTSEDLCIYLFTLKCERLQFSNAYLKDIGHFSHY